MMSLMRSAASWRVFHAAEEGHHLRVGVHRGHRVDIIERQRAQQQTLSLNHVSNYTRQRRAAARPPTDLS
jgi:hypothetical protein